MIPLQHETRFRLYQFHHYRQTSDGGLTHVSILNEATRRKAGFVFPLAAILENEMSEHPLKTLIQNADHAISNGDFDSVMRFYADDATLVVKPGLNVTGKVQIRNAFDKISAYFNGQLAIRQGEMIIIEGGDTALVIMISWLDIVGSGGLPASIERRATYVFRREADDNWLCVIDNSYGTTLLNN